jgi:aminoglycoside phosphotransferase (APT) family kinase protein
MGIPGGGYPWHWSVYRWLDGENAMVARIDDLTQFALRLGQFLTALQTIDPTDGPPLGKHNFYRGGPLTTYDSETRNAIAALHGKIDTNAATALWEAALQATWHGPPVWLHGDMSSSNLLVMNGRLSAVIDFGCSGVGDPSCDLTIAWTFFSGESRETFRRSLAMDDATWARSRGWALWKALITLAGHVNTNPSKTKAARRVIEDLLGEHETE